MGIEQKITSLRQVLSSENRGMLHEYTRPSPEKLLILQRNLAESENAKSYLKIERGIADDTALHFGLGYDPDKNAIAIPNFKNGELINIMYRHLNTTGKQSKYTQERDAEVWLYNEDGINESLKKGGVLIVEGQFDCMSAWQAGIKNVVSVGSGKDSYGMWVELLEPIPKVYIAYDNDKAGKESSNKFAERIGVEKCQEVLYPEGIKDANDYFKKYEKNDFKLLVSEARPFYTRRYNDMQDVIAMLRADSQEKLQIDILPDVKISDGHLISLSAATNVGKTMFVLNVAKRLVDKGIPTLILPFERGTQVVGSRFLQILSDKTEEELRMMGTADWDKLIKKLSDYPAYFALPTPPELLDVLRKAKRILGIKAVIVDHLDYMIRNQGEREDVEIRNRLHELKSLAIEEEMILFVVTHTRRIHQAGSEGHKKPSMHDIRGSSAVEQDSEVVVILDKVSDTEIEVDVQKNKGKMVSKVYAVDYTTGVIGGIVDRATSLDDF